MDKSTLIMACVVALVAIISVTVRFSLPTGYYIAQSGNQLIVSTSGRGYISSSPSGIECGAACSELFPSGSSVTLRARAFEGATFTGWDGACSGTETTCTVKMDGAKAVSSRFSSGTSQPSSISVDNSDALTLGTITPQYQPQESQTKFKTTTSKTYFLLVGKPTGGKVKSNDGRIDCPPTCRYDKYSKDTTVTLEALPPQDSTFGGWSGDLGGTTCFGSGQQICTVAMNDNKYVAAGFTEVQAQPTPTPITPQPPTVPQQLHCCLDPRYNAEYALENACKAGFLDQGVQKDCNQLAVQLRKKTSEPITRPLPPEQKINSNPAINNLEDLKKLICQGYTESNINEKPVGVTYKYDQKGKVLIGNIEPMGGRGRRFVEDAG